MITALRGPSILQINFVLDVEVSSPMTDLCCALVLGDCHYGEIILVVNDNGLLVRVKEPGIR